MGEAYRDRERVFAGVMADRADWEAATRQQRHLSVAADAEIRRRHPEQRFTPLRSAESPAATDARRAELTLTTGQDIPDAGPWIKDLAAGRRRFAARADRDCCADDDGRLAIAASAAAAAGSHNHRDQVAAAYLDGH